MHPPSPQGLKLRNINDKNGRATPIMEACQGDIQPTPYLPVEIWRRIFYQVIDENEEVARIDRLDMKQLGPAPFEGFHHDISNSVQACNLALVCRLWQDLSEEVRYRHLYVSDINSIQRLKAFVTKPAFNRIRPPSSLDPRYRTRGSWTHSLTISSGAAVPSSFYSAQAFHLEKALLSLLSCLPNIRKLISCTDLFPGRHLLNNLPKSISHLSLGEDGGIYLRLFPRQVCTRMTMLHITLSGDIRGYPVQLTNLLWLSIRPRTYVVTAWAVPNLSFLTLILLPGEETALSNANMRNLGTNLLRMELQNVGNLQMGINPCFLQWCPQLETLIFDFFGFTFLDSTPQESRSFSSIKTIVLIIGKWSQFWLTGDDPSFIDERAIHIQALLDFILGSLPNLSHLVLSFSRKILFSEAGVRGEIEFYLDDEDVTRRALCIARVAGSGHGWHSIPVDSCSRDPV